MSKALNLEFIHKIKLSFRKDRELYYLYRNKLGFFPKNISLYTLAMTHTSAKLRDAQGQMIDNERLEYLGDAILDAAVAEILYRRFPKKREGFLTSTRSKIVQREHLNEVATKMGIDKLVVSDAKSNHTHNNYIYGNAMEALIGAIYLDRGYKRTKTFIEEKIIDRDITNFAKENTNPKSQIIEWAQRRHYIIEFRLDKEDTDSDNNPIFHSTVLINGAEIANGKGYTKKESHQAASRRGLRKIHNDSRIRSMLASLSSSK